MHSSDPVHLLRFGNVRQGIRLLYLHPMAADQEEQVPEEPSHVAVLHSPQVVLSFPNHFNAQKLQ